MSQSAPLVKALFQTNDVDESDVIRELMHAFEANSPWPRRLYDSSDAQNLLRPYFLKGFGVDDFYK